MSELSLVEPASWPTDIAGVVRQVIFKKLGLVYGQRLVTMYQGIPWEAVYADWALELEGESPEGIHYALKHLPPTDFPPNVHQFRAISQQRPTEAPAPIAGQKKLPMDGGSNVPAFARQVWTRIQQTRNEPGEPVRIRTARRFIERVTAEGHYLTPTEREWLPHMRELVNRFEASQGDAERTQALKDAAQAKVDDYLAGNVAIEQGFQGRPDALDALSRREDEGRY